MSQAQESSGSKPSRPICPLCGQNSYRREQGKLDSKWGLTAHRVTLLICQNCQYILQFYEGNSIWDFD